MSHRPEQAEMLILIAQSLDEQGANLVSVLVLANEVRAELLYAQQ